MTFERGSTFDQKPREDGSGEDRVLREESKLTSLGVDIGSGEGVDESLNSRVGL